jgi:predicted AlkP superfamily phosphohydrolase/phosphomutase
MPTRVLVVALDGADAGLLRRWAPAGALPTLARLMATGSTGIVTGPQGLGDDAVWASFWTGREVGDHGRYFWDQRHPETGVPLGLDQCPSDEPFWVRLGRTGHRVAVLDIPKCPASAIPGGIHLCDWLVHGRSHPAPVSHPPPLASAVVDRFGAAPPSRCSEIIEPMDDAETRAVADRLIAAAGMKGDAALHYLGADAWDVFMIAFKEAHCASHMLWHLVDPDHPAHEPGRDDRLGAPLLAIHQAIDAALGRLIAQAGEDVATVVLAPLGMARNVTGNHFLEELVARFDRAQRTRRGATTPTCSVLPHNEASGAIRIHVAGRDPGGTVAPGAAFADLRGHLARALADLTDAETGRPIVEAVIEAAEAWPGERIAMLPDLFVVWRRDRPFRAVRSALLGVVEAPLPAYRSGNHVSGGLYIVGGERRPARVPDLSMAGFAGLIEDLAAAPGGLARL